MNSSLLLMSILGIGAIVAAYFALKSKPTKHNRH